MFIERVDIKNFKGIDENTLEFKQGFNLIIGENGRGKTSILEAISVGLGGFLVGISDVKTRHFSQDEIRRIIRRTGEGSCDETYCVPIEVRLKAKFNGEEFEWTRGRSSVKASRSTVRPRKICKAAERISMDESAEYPILVYEGAGRVWSQRREKTENVFRTKYSRTVGYMDALLEASNMKLLLNWCVKMEQVSWKKEVPIAEYEAAKKAVSDFMSYMNGGGTYQVFYDKQLEDMMYSFEDKILPISSLSAGYQSLIWMVFDIAYRMAVLNPDKKDEICLTFGVVLIDEIDIHLHPKWQWNIIDALRKTFPNVQFIATTHSPILFSSAKDVWIIDIEKDEYAYGYSHYGLDINSSLKMYQETTMIPEDVQKQVDCFYDMLDGGNYDGAKKILEELEVLTAPEHPILIQMRTQYEFETMKLGE